MTTPSPAVTLMDEQVILYVRDLTGLPEERVYKGQEISDDEDRPIPEFVFAVVLGSPHLPQCFAQSEYVQQDAQWLERSEVNFQASYGIVWSGPGAFAMAHEFEGRMMSPWGHEVATNRNFAIQDAGQVQETSATVAEDWDQRAGVDILISYWMNFYTPIPIIDTTGITKPADLQGHLATFYGDNAIPDPVFVQIGGTAIVAPPAVEAHLSIVEEQE